MRTTRKLLALLLAVAMVFTMTAMTALATGGDDGTTTPDSAPTTPGGGTTTPDGGATAPGGGPATPDGGPATPGGDPTTPEVSAEAQAVIALIEALPEFDTLDSDEAVEAFEAKVSEARVAYDALAEEQQAEVTNYETLTQAEAYLTGPTNITPRGTDVCAIGTTGYPTLEAAVAAVQPDEPAIITMLTNAELTTLLTIPKEKNILLDLHGCTITAQEGPERKICNYGTLTIQATGGGTIENTESNSYGLIDNYGSLTINGGTFMDHGYGNGASIKNRNGTLVINDGAFQGTSEDLVNANTRIANEGSLTINGGTYTTQHGQNPSIKIISGNASVQNATITSRRGSGIEVGGGQTTLTNNNVTIQEANSYYASAIAACYGGSITVNSGFYSSQGYGAYVYSSGGTIVVKNGSISGEVGAVRADVDSASYPNATALIQVEGGTTEGQWSTNNNKNAKLVASGGTHDDVSQFLAAGMKQSETGEVIINTDIAVAKIGNVPYISLQAAVDAIANDADTTITLLKTTQGPGVKVPSGKNITFDLGGHTYTVIEPLVGSQGTKTNGFQFLKDSNIIIKNGAINGGTAAKILLQNYSNLTLKGVTLDAQNSDVCEYVLSNNNGRVYITGKTNIYAAAGGYAFDVYYWPQSGNGYVGGVDVTVNTTGVISGDIQYGSDGTDVAAVAEKAKLLIQNGTFTGEISTYGLGTDNKAGISISGGSFSKPVKDAFLATGFDCVWNGHAYVVKAASSGGGGGSGSYLPVILSPVWNQTVSVIEHGTLTMSVWASRASSYQWYVDRGDGRFVAIAGATGDSLTIWPDMGDNGNRYYCRAMNGYGGVDSHYFTLCVVRSTLPPKTGDQVCVTLWVCLMALGVAGALTAWNRQRNR